MSIRSFLGASLAALVLTGCTSASIHHNTRLTAPIDESVRTPLTGNTRPEVTTATDLGRVDDGLVLNDLQLLLQRSPEQEQALQQFLQQQQTPASPNYHHWLTSSELGERFGASSEDIATISGWLESHGFEVNSVHSGGLVVDFTGTAGQVREAFQTEIHTLDVKGVSHIANMSDPTIPAALAPVVNGIVSLHDFRPKPKLQPRTQYTFTSDGSEYQAVVPADLATIYNFNPLFAAGITGQGETIAVVEDTDLYTAGDWNVFRQTFGLSSYKAGSLRTVWPQPQRGHNNCQDPGVNPDDVEAILDVEWASAAAPSAAIEMATCNDTQTTFGGLIAFQNLIAERNPPDVISMSYGECETYNGAAANAAYKEAYEEASAEGISVFVSAGDEGAASCDADEPNATHGIGVSGFASTPYNVAVGGTDFGDSYAGTNASYWNGTNGKTDGSALSYVPEIPWNDSCAGALLSSILGYATPYGTDGFCNSDLAAEYGLVTTAAGSGGPSGCATGNGQNDGLVNGNCQGYDKPWWQQSIVGNPNDGVRDLPDVSLFAANGIWGHYYVVCYSDEANGGVPCVGAPENWSGAGGTSFASPIMAGVQALVDQRWGDQGLPTPTYYAIANNEYGQKGSAACNSTNGNATSNACTFYDVTLGDMDVNCSGPDCYDPSGTYGVLSTTSRKDSPAYGTSTGWDFATGIGTVNAANLVNNRAWSGW